MYMYMYMYMYVNLSCTWNVPITPEFYMTTLALIFTGVNYPVVLAMD